MLYPLHLENFWQQQGKYYEVGGLPEITACKLKGGFNSHIQEACPFLLEQSIAI